MTNEQINEAVKNIREREAMIKELQSEIDSYKDEIKADMTNKAVEELSTGLFTIKYREVTGNRFDTTAFKKDHLDLYEAYTKSNSSMRLNIN